jgi:hypothetical protein
MEDPSTVEMPHPEGVERPKVIYVIGAGRSGSTILGVTLGNCSHIFNAGELDKWLARSGVSQLEDPQRARFWSAVGRDVDAGDLFGHEAKRCLERSSALFRIRDWPARRHLRGRYRRVSEDLYRAIARERGVTHIVDTSHYPLRARELQALTGIELYILFQVRDPQSVVASFARRDVAERSFGVLAANAYLWLTYLLSMLVFLRHPRERRLFMRHEQFVEDPAGALRQILDLVGCNDSIPDLAALSTGVAFQGNRLLKSEVVSLRREAAPPRGRSLATTLLQLPWAAVFSLLRPALSSSRSRPRTPERVSAG